MNWEEDDNTLEINADGTFFLDTETGQWQWHHSNETLLESESGLGFGFMGQVTIATFHLNSGQNFFGLGEKTGAMNRKGSSYTNWNTDAFAYNDGRDPLYVSIPFYLSVHQGICYGILVDNTCKTRFNFGASNKRMVQISASVAPMNLIFLPGPTPQDVLRRYHELTGPMAFPPKWALGLQQCRYSYYPEHELLSVARNFRSRNIPCDVLYLDIHYMDGYKVFTSDKNRFPNLKKMCGDLNEMGFRVVPIQDPGVKTEIGYDPYDRGLEDNIFVRYPDGEHWVAGVWPGDCVFPDFTDPNARIWWTKKTAKWVEESGVNGLWNDMNEPATWGQDVPDMLEFSMDGRGGSHLEAHNVYGQLMAESSRSGLLQCRPEERPFMLTRAGYAGIHRSAAVWSGDNIASEEHYFLGIRLVLSMAMSGVAFSGPDVGGFVGDAGRNLFVRWISVASFFPFFRLHSMIDSRDNEPWSYGELAEAIAGNYIRLRYKLLPTLYSAFKKSSITGKSIVKPYFWEKPFLEFDPAFQHQFIWCDQMLIIPAPSDHPSVKADLPEGDWFHLLTGEKYSGGSAIWLTADIDTLPILVRAGSIFVTRNPGTHSMDLEINTFQIHVFYGQGESNFYFYDDDGVSISPAADGFIEAELSFDFSRLQLGIKNMSGQKISSFTTIYLWHFPEIQMINFNNRSHSLQQGNWSWLESLPNFDPFEDKGKSYFSTCQVIHIPG
ncbi:MAG TPA: glycoside hydrolase family 31 protein [Catalimonadaceae bacterium]|nr:glycoside hydrolase family 31 protein [Catalimonadaceae bacterium]